MEDVWRINPKDQNLVKIPTWNGYKSALSWSPDQNYLAFIGYESQEDSWFARNSQLWLLPHNGEPPRSLNASLDRISENVTLSDVREIGCQVPKWSQDSKSIFYLLSDQGSCFLYTVDLQGNNSAIINNKMDISGFSVDASGTSFAILAATPTHPAEIFHIDDKKSGNASSLYQITSLNQQIIDQIQISEPVEVLFTSADQTPLQGWLLKPPDFDEKNSYPLVLYIHGGPAAQYGNTFFHEFQVLAAHGYLVLYTNPRGSLGREEAFATSIQGNWGKLDYEDLMAAVNYAEVLPYIDGTRMAVVGGSYGGFMTTWIIGNTHRFRCAISERGISNRHSAVGSNDYPPLPDGYWSGNPWDDVEKLWQQSPLRFAAEIATPLLIIHSEGDLRCPISQAEQLFSALKKLEKEVMFLRYPSETNHGLSRSGPPDLRVDRLQQILRWLDHHLKDGETHDQNANTG
jgi:dipeptidyl aminopeptidase/acylaminoacyl peptidase